jgi:protein SCO1/2
MRNFVIVLIAALLLAACQKPSAPPAASPNAKHYPIRGTVVSVDKANKKAAIKHDAIEGYMEAMTMDFPIHADWAWDKLTPGATIQGDLVVDNQAKEPYWIENIVIQAPPGPGQAEVPVNDKFAQVGKEVPDFTLTNQNGKPVSFHDFKGKALAITFIYAKCPLPDYCTRMSTNFSDIAMQVDKDASLKDKVRLLSISFDPANDTPDKLKAYGIGYMGNDPKYKFDVWQLAVGKDAEVRKIADFFGLQYEVDANDKTKINHSLVTAVIGPDGKVTRIFTGNSWTPAQLLEELKTAAG